VWDKVLNWFNSKKAPVQDAHFSWKWAGCLVLFAVGVGLLIYFYIRYWQKGLKIAQQNHDRDLLVDQANHAKAKQIIENDLSKVAANEARVVELAKQIREIDVALKTSTTEMEQLHEKIEDIHNWDDLSKFMGK
jgi:Tfp pilus assembly protein PilN